MAITLVAATEADFPAIITMMNAAFRGTGGVRGWSIEADYIKGQRTNESLLREEIAAGALYLLAKEEATSALQGCVCLQSSSPEKWYLGALTVNPSLQSAGFGSQLLHAAEHYAAIHGAQLIEITVVHVREALIAWYERRGYRRTGETRPFPYGDNRYGTPMRDDLQFVVFEKHLRAWDAASPVH
jgi:GNAT superfamily N-acetyltransferase